MLLEASRAIKAHFREQMKQMSLVLEIYDKFEHYFAKIQTEFRRKQTS